MRNFKKKKKKRLKPPKHQNAYVNILCYILRCFYNEKAIRLLFLPTILKVNIYQTFSLCRARASFNLMEPFQPPCQEGIIIFPIKKISKLRFREIN